jgi:hypothetical protein
LLPLWFSNCSSELQGFAVQLAEDTKALDLAAGKLSDEIRRVRSEEEHGTVVRLYLPLPTFAA